jgi:hypothetical protein
MDTWPDYPLVLSFFIGGVPSDLKVCSFDGLFLSKMINVIEYFGI